MSDRNILQQMFLGHMGDNTPVVIGTSEQADAQMAAFDKFARENPSAVDSPDGYLKYPNLLEAILHNFERVPTIYEVKFNLDTYARFDTIITPAGNTATVQFPNPIPQGKYAKIEEIFIAQLQPTQGTQTDTIEANGSVTSPGVGAAIATTANAPAGSYQVTVNYKNSGTAETAVQNLQLRYNNVVIATVPVDTTSTTMVSYTFPRVTVAGGAAFSVNANAAGVVGSIYNAWIAATIIGTATGGSSPSGFLSDIGVSQIFGVITPDSSTFGAGYRNGKNLIPGGILPMITLNSVSPGVQYIIGVQMQILTKIDMPDIDLSELFGGKSRRGRIEFDHGQESADDTERHEYPGGPYDYAGDNYQ